MDEIPFIAILGRGFLASLLLCGALAGQETVLLTSGDSLEAASVEFHGEGVRIELGSGGAITLPHDAVDSVLSGSRTGPAHGRLQRVDLREVPRLAAGEALHRLILEVCRRHEVDPQLVAAVVHVESSGDPEAISEAGACGLMQLLPETARDYGIDDLFDPAANLEAGVRHLRRLLDRYQDPVLALAAYNAGEGRVERYGGVPPFAETRDYVRKVTRLAGIAPQGGILDEGILE